MAFGVCPLKAWLTTHSRPRGVKRAFLCTFIRFLSLEAEVSQPHLPRPEPDGQPIESSQLGRGRASRYGSPPLTLALSPGQRIESARQRRLQLFVGEAGEIGIVARI